jgi:hypothetical protein
MHQGRFLAVLTIATLTVVMLAGAAVEVMGDFAVGALLGALAVLVALGLRQQMRYARRLAAEIAALSRALTSTDRGIVGVKKDVVRLSEDVAELSAKLTTWSKDVKMAEIETGIAALNRYVALGSDDSVRGT